MGHAAVLVRGPALVSHDDRRDRPEHSLPVETERATSSTARQEKSAVTRRHDTAQRVHRQSYRRVVLECGHDQEPGRGSSTSTSAPA